MNPRPDEPQADGLDRTGLIARLSLLLMAATVLGCPPKVNLLQAIDLVPGQTLALGTALNFIPSGLGTCGSLHVDWGDGTTADFTTVDLTAHSQLQHTLAAGGAGRP